jgi:4-hydroxyphenylacetate 3-monooxygenase
VAVVGYAGRDSAAVKVHVEELASLGVARPDEVPAVWSVPSSLLTDATVVRGRAGATSGEVEPVLVVDGTGQWLLTVGSDHTDRKLEAESMQAAKEACAKVVARSSVALSDVGDWDAVELSSQIRVDGEWVDYQRGSLAELQPLSWYRSRFADRRGVVVFCGTVPTVDGLRTDGDGFRGVLRVPGGPTLTVEYEVAPS